MNGLPILTLDFNHGSSHIKEKKNHIYCSAFQFDVFLSFEIKFTLSEFFSSSNSLNSYYIEINTGVKYCRT